jgi:hypothetical protein
MGAGASIEGIPCNNSNINSPNHNNQNITVTRLRKALLIRAYNKRSKNPSITSVEEQFRIFAHRNQKQVLCITVERIKQCLGFTESSSSNNSKHSNEGSSWVDELFKHTLGDTVS